MSLAALPGCGFTTSHYARIDRTLEAGHPSESLEILERHKDKYGTKSEVLYLMDKGMLQHLAGVYKESNRSLAKAEQLTEDLYTRRIHSEVEAFVTTDNALPYEGEDFEKVMLNVVMAMNYVQLGQWDDALVEARKVDHKLSVLSQRNSGRMAYTQDPFARYLSGILYEAVGELPDAFVAYRLAFAAFERARTLYGTAIPDLVRKDLLRVSEALGLNEEHAEYRRRFPDAVWQSEEAMRAGGELIFVTYAGRAPLKRDVFVDVPFSPQALGVVLATKLPYPNTENHRAAESILYGLTGHVIRIAVPKFRPRPSAIVEAEAVAVAEEARHVAPLPVTEDITAIAVRDLEDRIVRTSVKAAARGAWKYALAEGAGIGVGEAVGKNGRYIAGAIAGAIARTIAIASEEADKRSWATLPGAIRLGRERVPPGTYDVEFRYAGPGGGALASQAVRGVTVRKGQKRFIISRVVQ